MNKSNDKIPKAELRLAEKIAKQEAANQKFHALPPAKKRVAIAKDVLKWLRIGKLKPLPQMYFVIPSNVDSTVNGSDCHACALGSLFACAVEHGEAGGNIRLTDYESTTFASDYGYREIIGVPGSRTLYEALAKHDLFEPQQLGLIEIAFEGRKNVPSNALEQAGGYSLDRSEDLEACKRADEFFYRYPDPRTRMTKIMQNIIRNNGTFKP